MLKAALLFAAMATVAVVPVSRATLILGVDFQHTTTAAPGVTQGGFQAFDQLDGGSALYSTVAGDVTVTMTGLDAALGGHFNRGGVNNGGALTYADIYNDFAFKNGVSPQSMTLGLSGPGIAADTSYILTFYSYDDFNFGGPKSTVDFTGISGTTGSASLSTPHDGTDPTSNDAYAGMGIFAADGSGALTIDLTASGYNGSQPIGVRLNAFELAAIPEPSSLALIGLGGLAMLLRGLRGRFCACAWGHVRGDRHRDSA